MSVKTILVAHKALAVRDRFAAALAEAKQEYLLAGGGAALRAALQAERAPISLALLDLALADDRDPIAFLNEVRGSGARPVPVVVFAGSVSSASQIEALGNAGVAGYINEHADAPHILPALAPHLFPHNFNRRSGSRIAVAVPVSFRAGHTVAAAQTRDLGRGGAGIQMLDPLPPGTPLQLTIRVPGAASEISALGRIVWSDRRVGMGVQFERLTSEAQTALETYVERTAG